MPDNTKLKNLFHEFPPVPDAEWENVLQRDLKGADYREKLKWETLEGIDALPFYRKDHLKELPHYRDNALPVTPQKWHYCETIYASSPKEANLEARNAVENGAGAIRFVMEVSADIGEVGSDITGTAIHSVNDLKTLLEGIDPKATAIFFDAGMISPALIAMLRCCAEEDQKYNFLMLSKSSDEDDDEEEENDRPVSRVSQDPFRYYLLHGRAPADEDSLNNQVRHAIDTPGFLTLAADGTLAYNSGATIVQSLAIALAAASEYMARTLEDQREKAAQKIWLRLPAGSLYFPEIAKFRAARMLWDRVLDGYKIGSRKPLFIQAETARWNKSAADARNNILRATTEAMAAVVGGADSVIIDPFDAPFNRPDKFSSRIARNISHILKHESHLDKVANPADGSWYIEALTDQISEKTWDFFRTIEKQGGLVKAIESRMIQTEIEQSAAAKNKALAKRKLVMTGVNNYPNSGETLPDRLHRSKKTVALKKSGNKFTVSEENPAADLQCAFKNGALLGDLVPALFKPQKQLFPTLVPYRAAEPFEKIRSEVQQLADKRGIPVTVQLLSIGNKKWRKARAGFSRNFMECGGFAVEEPAGWDVAEEAVKEADLTGKEIVVFCGADDEYTGWVASLAQKEKFKNKIVLLAGNPGSNKQEYEDAGIDGFIYTGVDMIEQLNSLLGRLKAEFKAEGQS